MTDTPETKTPLQLTAARLLLLEFAASHPVFDVADASNVLRCTTREAQPVIDQLIEEGSIIAPARMGWGPSGTVVYCAKEIT